MDAHTAMQHPKIYPAENKKYWECESVGISHIFDFKISNKVRKNYKQILLPNYKWFVFCLLVPNFACHWGVSCDFKDMGRILYHFQYHVEIVKFRSNLFFGRMNGPENMKWNPSERRTIPQFRSRKSVIRRIPFSNISCICWRIFSW